MREKERESNGVKKQEKSLSQGSRFRSPIFHSLPLSRALASSYSPRPCSPTMLTRSSLRLAHAHLILSTKNNAESSEKETGGRTFPMALQRCRRLDASATAVAVALALFVFALATPASAGDWKGRPHRLYTEEDYHLNHVPVPLLTKDKMPKEFSWANARGRHLLVRTFFFLFFVLLSSSFFSFRSRSPHLLQLHPQTQPPRSPPGTSTSPSTAAPASLTPRSR